VSALGIVKRVLDSSAILAWFQREPGFELVRTQLEIGGFIAAPNLTEVIGKLISSGIAPANEVERDVLALGVGGCTDGRNRGAESRVLLRPTQPLRFVARGLRVPGDGWNRRTRGADRRTSLGQTS
jgi:hypothetical protein